jgi:peptide deformylase
VLRPAQASLSYQDVEGQPHTLTATGLFGRVLQHEYDHTAGTLFTERMSRRTLFSLQGKLKRLKRETRNRLKELPTP